MDLKTLPKKTLGSEEERAVSPVIGVVLMVAVTVILAAVIAAVVIGIGDDMDVEQPTDTQTEMSVNGDWHPEDDSDIDVEDALYVSHHSGETIDEDDLRVVVRDGNGATVGSFDADYESPENAPDDVNDGDIDIEDETWYNENDGVDNGVLVEVDGSYEGESFTGGSTVTVHVGEDFENEEMTVQLIHTPSDTTVADHTDTVPEP